MTSQHYREVLDVVVNTIVEILSDRGIEIDETEVAASTPLFGYEEQVSTPLDLDSMDALDIISVLEERFEVELPADLEFVHIRTVDDVVHTVVALVDENR